MGSQERTENVAEATQRTLEEHKFELGKSTYGDKEVFSLPYNFLNIFFSLAYFKKTVYDIYNVKHVC